MCVQATEDGSMADRNVVQSLSCHGLWLNYFDEMWDSVGDGAAATTQQASLREVGGCVGLCVCVNGGGPCVCNVCWDRGAFVCGMMVYLCVCVCVCVCVL